MRLFTVVSNSFAAPAGGWAANDFDFNNITAPTTTNTVTFTNGGTLCIAGAGSSMGAIGYFNGVELYWHGSQANALSLKQSSAGLGTIGYTGYYAAVDVVANNTLYFEIADVEPPSDSGTINIYSNTFKGTLICSFTITKEGCYLTTATVLYKNLQDDGPELTAMRTLREYFRGDVYYDNLIEEYYQLSPIIIQKIDLLSNPEEEYESIYQSVLKVKSFVDSENWEQAQEEYLNTYFTLKNKYIQP